MAMALARHTSLGLRRIDSFAGTQTVSVCGESAVRVGDDAFEHRDVDLVQVLDIQTSDASGMRPQLLELPAVPPDAIQNPAAGASSSRGGNCWQVAISRPETCNLPALSGATRPERIGP